MSEIGKLIGTLLTMFSILGAVTFYDALNNGLYAVTQGDPDGAQEVVEVIADETVSTIKGEIVLVVLGILGSIMAIFIGAIKNLG